MSDTEPTEKSLNSIRAIRLSKGMSQQALADLVGTSQSQIDRLERGARRLTVEWIGKISRAFQMRPSELIGWDASASDNYLQAAKGSKSFTHVLPSADDGTLPLYATVPHPTKEDLFIIPDIVIGSINRPSGIVPGDDAFAFHNPTSMMSPRWGQGELVFVSRQFTPRPGGPTLLMFENQVGYGERAVTFCKSSISSGINSDGPLKVFASFYGSKTEWGSDKWIFPLEIVANRYMVYDWMQLLGI